MTPLPVTIVHLVAADLRDERAAALTKLLGSAELARRQVLVHVGAGGGRRIGGVRPLSVYTLLDGRWLNERCLAHALRRAGVSGDGQAVLVHAWSQEALRWCGPRVLEGRGLIVEAAPASDVEETLTTVLAAGPVRRVAWVGGHPRDLRRLVELGVPEAQCRRIDPDVDVVAVDENQRAATRERLELAAEDVAVVVLPPTEHLTGAMIGVWGTLLLEKVRPEVRCVASASGAGERRIRRLVRACRHDWMVRFAPPEVGTADLIAAADVCVYLPPGSAPVTSVASARAAGKRLVVTAPVLEALPVEGALVCRANDPEDVARQMLVALDGEVDRDRRPTGRSAATGMVDAYQRLYAELIAG